MSLTNGLSQRPFKWPFKYLETVPKRFSIDPVLSCPLPGYCSAVASALAHWLWQMQNQTLKFIGAMVATSLGAVGLVRVGRRLMQEWKKRRKITGVDSHS